MVKATFHTITTSKDEMVKTYCGYVQLYLGALYVEVMSGFAANDERWQVWLNMRWWSDTRSRSW